MWLGGRFDAAVVTLSLQNVFSVCFIRRGGGGALRRLWQG